MQTTSSKTATETLSTPTKYSIVICSVLFLALSTIIYISTPTTASHSDIDSPGYQSKAELFYQTNSFVEKGDSPVVQQPLGYPLFMGIVYKATEFVQAIFGSNSTHETRTAAVIWMQVLLTLLSGLLIFFATRYIFDNATSIIAYALFSLNLGCLVFEQFILSETLQFFFLVLFVERFVHYLKSTKLSSLLTAGFSLGVSTVVKPAALYYIVPLLVIFIPFTLGGMIPFARRGGKAGLNLSQKIVSILCLIFSFYAPIKLHELHNYMHHGSTSFSSHGNYNLYICFWSKVAAEQQNPTSLEHERELFLKKQSELTNMIQGNPLEEESWAEVKAALRKAVYQDPISFIKIWIREMIQTWGGLYTTNLKVLLEPKTKGGDVSFFGSNLASSANDSKSTIWQKVHNYITSGTTKKSVHLVGFIEFFWNIFRCILVLIALLLLLIPKAFPLASDNKTSSRWFLLLFFSSYLSYFTLITGFDGHARYRFMFECIIIILSAVGIRWLWLYLSRPLKRRETICSSTPIQTK